MDKGDLVRTVIRVAVAAALAGLAIAPSGVSAKSSARAVEPVFGSKDPLGLLPDYEMLSTITEGTDIISVWRCKVPANTTVPVYQNPKRFSMTIAQAISWMEKHVVPYFEEVSKGRYTIEFVAGGTITLAPDEDNADCMDRTRAKVSAPATNVVAFDNAVFNGGIGSPGSYRCQPADGCMYNAQRGLPPKETYRAVAVGGDVIGSNNKTIVHEIGHSLGWPHSRVDPSKPYENVWDVMSGFVPCFNNRTCIDGAQHTLAINRYHSGWIDETEVRVHAKGSATYDLAAPLTTGIQFVIVPLPKGRFLTVEARPATGIDKVLPFSGVAVHVVKPQPCSDTDCVYATDRLQGPPTKDAAKPKHIVRVGKDKTFLGVTIEVVAKKGTGFEVRISN